SVARGFGESGRLPWSARCSASSLRRLLRCCCGWPVSMPWQRASARAACGMKSRTWCWRWPGARCSPPHPRRTRTIHPAAQRRAWIVATTMVGSVSTILAATIVNVAFPAMMREFNIGHDSLQWVATGFLAATTTTMLATSWLVESFGQRNTFVTTMAVFLAASMLGASSWSTESLIAARVLQGAAAGVMQPLSMIAVFEVFPLEQRGRAMGVFGFGIVLAPAVGPTIGGLLTQAFGWRAIFLLSVPFCIAALPLGWRWLSAARASAPRQPLDWFGTLLLTGALVAVLNFSVIGHRDG